MNDISSYPILDVSDWLPGGEEMMGQKPKQWLIEPETDTRWLFKYRSRSSSQDDWSEKVAAELAGLLGLPHAHVELAERRGAAGIISRDICAGLGGAELVPGNQILHQDDSAYQKESKYRGSMHTVERVRRVLAASTELPGGIAPDACLHNGWDLFVGYLLFDAWIANTDRHHQNWAVLRFPSGVSVLSPTYDHAASLGHNLSDPARTTHLTTRDRNLTVAAFVRRPVVRSALFESPDDRKPLGLTAAFGSAAAAASPGAAAVWVDRLRGIDTGRTTEILWRVPAGIMSVPAKEFASALLGENRSRLTAEEA